MVAIRRIMLHSYCRYAHAIKYICTYKIQCYCVYREITIFRFQPYSPGIACSNVRYRAIYRKRSSQFIHLTLFKIWFWEVRVNHFFFFLILKYPIRNLNEKLAVYTKHKAVKIFFTKMYNLLCYNESIY